MPNELNLNHNIEVLKVNVLEKTYDIPLANSLPYKKVKPLLGLLKKDETEQMDAVIEFFKDYIDPEVVDSLPMTALTELATAWSSASGGDGESLGKSSASET